MKLDIPQVLARLAEQRPVFHSEADFQHSLAWQIRDENSSLRPRLEYPFEGTENKTCDIVLFRDGGIAMAIELKYFGENIKPEIDGEIFNLKKRDAVNENSYRAFSDVKRMEDFLEKNPSAMASVIILTNNHVYWHGPRNSSVNYAPFALTDGRSVTGHLDWIKRTPSNEKMHPICLHGSYTLRWVEYSRRFGQFRYLHIPIHLPWI